jgi:putative peptide zinc metalloprotease protein
MTATCAPTDRDLLQRIEQHISVDTSETQPVHLLIGRNGSHIRLSPSAVQLLRQVGRGVSFEQLAEALSQRAATPVSAADIESSYRKVIDRITEIEAQRDNARGAFWFRRAILPGRAVSWIARGCRAAFHPVVAALFIATIAVALALGIGSGVSLGSDGFWPAYGLLLASLVAHEIGHASACARYGAQPSEIGLALYVIYPVFYSNVSDAWTLKRWQRVVVDVGGVYFQLIVGAGYACGYALSGWEPLRFAVLLIVASCLFSLNPILKFDGYWVVADALGVTNLDRQPARLLRHLAARLRRRTPPPLPWGRWITGTLVLYSAVSIGFWIWFLWQVSPELMLQVHHAVHVLAALFVQLASPAWPEGKTLQAGAMSLYVLLLVVLMAWRLLRRIPAMVSRGRAPRGIAAAGAPVHP